MTRSVRIAVLAGAFSAWEPASCVTAASIGAANPAAQRPWSVVVPETAVPVLAAGLLALASALAARRRRGRHGLRAGPVGGFRNLGADLDPDERMRLLATALESASDCISITDTEDRVVFANRAFLERYGYSEGEVIGKRITFARSERNDPAAVDGILAATLGGGWRGELWNRDRAGNEFLMSLSTSAVVDRQGNPAALIGVARDITAIRTTEEELRESERRFRSLLGEVQLAATMVDRRGRLTFCNDFVLAIIGRSREEVIGSNFLEFVAPGETEFLADAFEAALRGSRDLPYVECSLLAKDGELRRLQWHNTTLRDSGGAVTGFASLGVDVTEHRTLQARLVQAQKLESLGRLAGGVAHDFNNLITVIGGYGSLLLRSPLGAEANREAVLEICKAGERARALTTQLLAFSRQQVVEPQVIDLNALVSGSEKMLRCLLGDRVNLRTSLAPGLGKALANEIQLTQVLMNLVANARDAMPGGGTVTIETSNVEMEGAVDALGSVAPRGPGILLSVSDTGAGMSAEVQLRIFEPFFTTKPAGLGTGLGLATVYGIVHQSGGYVRVNSAPGKGSTFQVFLPKTKGVTAGHRPAAVESPTPRGSATVLVVEDQTEVRGAVRRMLSRFGYRTLEASSGDEGLEVLSRHEGAVHLLLTDVMVPGVHGRAFADAARALRPEARVLFMSGYATEAAKAIELGPACAYIAKPFTAEDLAAKVSEVLACRASGLSVLIVDDERGVRELYRRALEEAGHRVALACEGSEAMHIVRSRAVDVVVCDLVMEGQEGIETIRALRLEFPELKIVCVSGASGGRYLDVAKLLGADEALLKPFLPADLLTVIENLTGCAVVSGESTDGVETRSPC